MWLTRAGLKQESPWVSSLQEQQLLTGAGLNQELPWIYSPKALTQQQPQLLVGAGLTQDLVGLQPGAATKQEQHFHTMPYSWPGQNSTRSRPVFLAGDQDTTDATTSHYDMCLAGARLNQEM